jgi:tRNA nucleotidyltransferase (CCA-adding enzyme)
MNNIKKIMEAIEAAGGKSYFVGGFVRDKILGRESKDIDIEVYNLEEKKLGEILNSFSKTSICGKSFGVFKLSYENQEYDFSLPRTDFQAGEKHNDIEVQTNPHLDMKTASSRRDLTINSLFMDLEGNIIDLHGGIEDLKNNALRATSDAFSDDPLRALRAARFSAVFNLVPDERILFLSRMMLEKVSTLPISRVQGEWVKIAQSSYPIRALDFLEKSGLIQIYAFFDRMQYTPQDKVFHPEGTVFQHTKHVCQAMAEICDRENITGKRRNILFFSALLHDVGKPHTTILKNGRWASPRHDKAGVSILNYF